MNLRLKCKLHACTAIACTFMMAFSSLTVCAEDINDMQNKKSELQNQLNSINSELDKISGEITDLQMQMEVTEAEIQRTKDAPRRCEGKRRRPIRRYESSDSIYVRIR